MTTTDDCCGDNRFEIIEKAKQDLLESTNISSSEDEMKVLDPFLFRCWQMGWLDKYDDRLRYCIEYINPIHPLLENGELNIRHVRIQEEHSAEMALTLILSFGAKIYSLYRGNVIEGKLDEWPTPMIVEDDDWYSVHWLHEILDQSFRNQAAKDILCATLSGGIAIGAAGILEKKELIVEGSIELANELVNQLKEKED